MVITKSKCKGVTASTTKPSKSNTKRCGSKKTKAPIQNKEVFPFFVNSFDGMIDISLPAYTASEANNFDHWTEKQKRHRSQKKWVTLAFTQCKVQTPCTVKLTRLSPGFLDADDNLRISLKWIKDHVAACITGDYVPGRADGNKNIKWEYDQIKSKVYGVKITINF